MNSPELIPEPADLDRRFGALSRLYGPEAPSRIRNAHVAVAGLGGVGSWTVEALARCGVGALTLIDLDHIAESNVNRQIHALSSTLGQSKVDAMAERVLAINPECRITRVDDFVSPENVGEVLPGPYTVIIDCTDQAAAKIAMILHARALGVPMLLCGGAGGKTDPLALRAGDLSGAVNDALLSKLRNKLRREHGFPRASDKNGKALKRVPKMGVHALWFDQPAILPDAWTRPREGEDDMGASGLNLAPQGLSCAGYGSVVTVTAAMGMAAANEALRLAV
ncbi:tRNA threonylcarbamoyladenosine dehydratase [Achromobacter mucicolens]|jgi:tRNA A37 threonylcarbamoyladenosine dehydratase|uniref:tRNA threonylcarbamoyladenosine dehydratase n=2 Tax=Alcaligenaceae TaxID=506 RepID=A0ABD4Z1R1_9BURK|nr:MULTISPECIES: tRNA threonylcarbamoyladenosine dehydratase [Achromobacter]MCP2516406.1 tRNA threonylcarbamoyladenosine dehydratase [Achromobacter mucicolens]MDF2862909.1 ThiF family protein [Achromobacter mucicolens]MDH1181029.1 tRNA threonylcarbamoyladenosine dehydratase [Achromobacter mucicolens]MDH1524677.1 tRNA threonylcarbamoyladenosine dehydratase [Achromobacter mucicolens]TQJ94530.1 tRNA A37 threonylcarbamoyladenosine dehydratase [Achromobacter sp. SLBN-14]